MEAKKTRWEWNGARVEEIQDIY